MAKSNTPSLREFIKFLQGLASDGLRSQQEFKRLYRVMTQNLDALGEAAHELSALPNGLRKAAADMSRPKANRDMLRALAREFELVLAEFDKIYAASRDPMSKKLAAEQLAVHLKTRVMPVIRALVRNSVPEEMLEAVSRYFTIRMAYAGAEESIELGTRVLASVPPSKIARYGETVFSAVTAEAERLGDQAPHLREILGAFPADDMFWKEFSIWRHGHASVTEFQIVGRLGELVTGRMPQLLALIAEVVSEVVAKNPHLYREGWRPEFIRTPSSMRKRLFGPGAPTDTPDLGESYDLVVCFRRKSTNEFMPLILIQVKTGAMATVAKGLAQIGSDIWRDASEIIRIVNQDGVEETLIVRPPDTFQVVRFLVGASDVTPAAFAAQAKAVAPGTSFVFMLLPWTARDFAHLGRIISEIPM